MIDSFNSFFTHGGMQTGVQMQALEFANHVTLCKLSFLCIGDTGKLGEN